MLTYFIDESLIEQFIHDRISKKLKNLKNNIKKITSVDLIFENNYQKCI